MNVQMLITRPPSYEAAVLEPLRRKQAEAAAQKAAAEAEQQRILEQERAEELARVSVVQAAQASVAPVQGDCYTWMAEAGITDTASALTLILRESGCNPCKYNPGKTGCNLTAYEINATDGETVRFGVACGMGQQLPCGKWPHAWNDPVGGLIDMQSYVMARYGSWANALAFHLGHNWY